MTSLAPFSASCSNLGRPEKVCNEYFLIGVSGGTASGKTSVCNRIISDLGDMRVALINMDSFYKGLEPGTDPKEYNFDHPNAFDYDVFHECLKGLIRGETVNVPVYDFKTHSRSTTEFQVVAPTPVIIVEGILVFYDQRIRDLLNMKVFVDTDADLRLLRRLKRDVAERGRSYENVLHQYAKFVKPAYDEFIAPSKRHADIILPHWPNEVAVDLIVENVRAKIGIRDLRRIYSNLRIMPHSSQCRQIHTIIRDVRCPRTDFVFYADRLIRLVAEYGLGCLPFKERSVVTPLGETYIGSQGPEAFDRVCCVSLVRAGESMEGGLLAVCKNIRIGKILLRFPDTDDEVASTQGKEPEIIYLKLPQDIQDRYVFLLDPVLGRGMSALSAVKILLDQGVRERNIIFLTLLASPDGIHTVCKQYPSMKVITTEIDMGIDDEGFCLPGVGDFADRYFGTEGTEPDFSNSPTKKGATPAFSPLSGPAGMPISPFPVANGNGGHGLPKLME